MIRQRKLMPWVYILLGLLVIASGTAALHFSGNELKWEECVFYSVSACCITGLSLDALNSFNFWGQLVMLVLIQIGGIGVMSLLAIVIEFLGGGLSRTQSSAYNDNLVQESTSRQIRIGSIFKWVAQYSLLCEALGGIVIFIGNLLDAAGNPLLYPETFGICSLFRALWNTVFLSISSFCNAGASPFAESLENCHILTQIGCGLLVIAGGFGIYVIADLRKYLQSWWLMVWTKSNKYRPKMLSLHTRVVLHATWVCLILGAAGIFFFGLCNLDKPAKAYSANKLQTLQLPVVTAPQEVVDIAAGDEAGQAEPVFHDLSKIDFKDLIKQSFFYSVYSRTAGFTATPLDELNIGQLMILTILMLIGGAPGSTAGGIKITTTVLIFFAFRSALRGQERTVIARRSIPANLVVRAFIMVGFFLAVILLGLLAVCVYSDDCMSTGANLFRVISAVTTAGYSCGTMSGQLAEKVIFMILMITGRLGPHAVIFFLLGREKRSQRVNFPEDKLILS